MKKEIYNVIKLKVGSIKIVNDHCLSINSVKFDYVCNDSTIIAPDWWKLLKE